MSVLSLEEYASNMTCHGKILQSDKSGTMAECSKCGSVMRVESCSTNKVARVVVKGASDGKLYKLTMFEKAIQPLLYRT